MCLISFGFNQLLGILFKDEIIEYVPIDITFFIVLNYLLIIGLKNKLNKIISYSWIIFFYLGVLNINSIKQQTNYWDLDLHDASLLYVTCLLVFNLSLIFFELIYPPARVKFKNDLII